MTRNQTKVDVRKTRWPLSILDRSLYMSLPLAGKHSTHVTKHQTPTRKSPCSEAIQPFEERTDSKEQNTEQYPFSSPSTSNTRSSCSQNFPTHEKPSGSDQRSSQKRKRSQSIEDQVPQTEGQPINPERKIFRRENETHHPLPSLSISNSHEQSSRKELKRAASINPCLEESNNRYRKRHKALRQTSQTVQFQETVPETKSPISKRSEEGPEALESKQKEKDDPISYWAANHTWPDNFAESGVISSSNNTNKRKRTLDCSSSGKDEKHQSYTQNRKDGSVPEQYTKSYEKYISSKGLDMNETKGRELISPDSKMTCKDLQNITHEIISPTVHSKAEIIQVIELSRNRNEATVNRNVTPLILPPIISLYLKDGGNQFKHLTEEVTTQWYESWVLAGPRPKPDLAVGFQSSAFTIQENAKLTYYTSFENLTRPTDELCFPFLMIEVKCGNQGLDYADRQNMHSCSVAVKAILKLEQKADQYREDKKFKSLLGEILVYSISHDQNNGRLYGHYALVEGEKWTYYRYHIASFDIFHNERDLLTLHNFALNILTLYGPKLLERLQKAIVALPVSSMISFSVSTMNLEDDSQQGSQQPLQNRDAEGFANLILPASTQKLFNEQKEQMDKLLQQMEQQRKENTEKEERQREQTERQMDELKKENKEKEERQRERMERQMDELKKEKDELSEQIKGLMDMLKQRLG